jgi:uncharacterized protein YyaL (SSP411 family)
LSAWLTPELTPFYGGTYFPPEDRHGRPGFPAILLTIARGWKDQREQLVAEGERAVATLREHYAEKASSPAADDLTVAGGNAFEKCFQYFYEAFDPQHGGFGSAPKFPRASNLDFLFRCAAIQGVTSESGAEAVKLATFTLQKMAAGGIHDHVGGGYHRYSVDAEWFVPHFEKMLYDQAQIAVNFVEAFQATNDERYAWMARDIFDYVQRDLTGKHGAFLTAEDADSAVPGAPERHAEGAFYVWTRSEIDEAVKGVGKASTGQVLAAHFGVLDAGNVDASRDPHGEFAGKNILAQRQSIRQTATQFELMLEEANDAMMAGIARLREIRAKRPRPLLDDKVLTACNGLMISAFARAAQILREPAYLEPARRAAEFVRTELSGADGLLYRAWREGRGTHEGFAEDYAYFIQGLIDLYEATFELRWLQWAEKLQAVMDARFWDESGGGYFNSQSGDASIVLRLKEDYDGAEPAPSSVAASNLLRLSAMLNDPELGRRAIRTIDAFRSQWMANPQAMPAMLCAVGLALEPSRQVVIVGDPSTADFRALADVLHERLGPRRALLAITSEADRAWLGGRAPWIAEMKMFENRATAYVCEQFTCQAPVNEPAALRVQLGV